ncbi:MAG: hypothetical protein JNL70_08995 [Saprospiraceae bacterium]|nr:hypothetical protein [Saprospiraceae bacterium]
MTFHANGKLLLTAEYFVLDGATALALPTKRGQSLTIASSLDASDTHLLWRSKGVDKAVWFEGTMNLDTLSFERFDGEKAICAGLEKIFKTVHTLNPDFWAAQKGILAESQLEFPRNWGLGSSSTLISLFAQWTKVDAFALSDGTFGGSGYDIACAGASKPIFYMRKNGQPNFTTVDFNPPFAENLYFVFLNQKQNSREGIARYREKAQNLPPQYFDDISMLTQAFYQAQTLETFEQLIRDHENKVASVVELPRAKSLYFNDFWGEIKSLGAWGGDFVLATSPRPFDATKQYFEKKGFTTILPYRSMIQL